MIFFQRKPNVNRDMLKTTSVSLYSMTPWREANYITKTILNFFGKNGKILKPQYGDKPIITDGTANCGGNTISFHLSNGFKQVNSVEIDCETCEMLKNNLSVYHLPNDNVQCCDYLNVYKNLCQDVVFLDCPWGGPNYIKTAELDLFLSSVNVVDICRELIIEQKVSLIVLKVPINYNVNYLKKTLKNRNILNHKIYRGSHNSYNVIFCW